MSGVTKFLFAGTIVLGVLIPASPSRAQNFDTFSEVCDASGAVPLATDMFLLADNNSDILRIYRFGKSKPVFEHDVTSFLGIKEGEDGKEAKEADIEAAARVGDLVYFITSHGLNSDTPPKHKEERLRLFAQQVSDETPGKITNFGNPYVLLLKRAMAEPEYEKFLAPVAGLAPEEGGINIEALAEGPDGSLYVGFRSPAATDAAYVMQIINPKPTLEDAPELIVGEKATDRLKRAGDAKTQLDIGKKPIIWKTLNGLGIRSMEKVDGTYLIIAGPPGKGSTFKLFSWSGIVGDEPAPVDGQELTFPEELIVKPEAIFKRQNGHLYVISDDGDLLKEENDQKKCEKLSKDKRHFRGFELPVVN